jgi:hypothetical protein
MHKFKWTGITLFIPDFDGSNSDQWVIMYQLLPPCFRQIKKIISLNDLKL